MASQLNPYLNFNGNARQALEFYTSVFGGNLSLNTFADLGAQDSPDADRIMHGMLQAWGDEFGMCVDKFGVPWMINVHTPEIDT